jgi:hypothetical protein
MLLAASESRREILGPNLISAADGGTRPKLRECSVSPASVLHILSQTTSRLTSVATAALVIGRKAAQERFSEENFREPCYYLIVHYRKRISQQLYRRHPQNSAKTHGTQQAWMNSRNSTTIATETKYRQPNLSARFFLPLNPKKSPSETEEIDMNLCRFSCLQKSVT